MTDETATAVLTQDQVHVSYMVAELDFKPRLLVELGWTPRSVLGDW